MNASEIKKGQTVYVPVELHVMKGCIIPYEVDFMEAKVLEINKLEDTVTVLMKHAIAMTTVPCSTVFMTEQAGRDAVLKEMENYVIEFRKKQLENYVNEMKKYQTQQRSNTMKINFKKLSPNAVEPRRATAGAAGFDMTATAIEDTPTCYKYHTGIALELPPGWSALAFPRSSIVKKGAWLGNGVGVIDSDYRGEITFCFYNFGNAPYKVGERIGQLVIVPVPDIVLEEAVELSETARGAGGYGSTGA